MNELPTAHEASLSSCDRSSSAKPYAVLGAGLLSAHVWKRPAASNGWRYEFIVFKVSPDNGTVSQRLAAEDLRDLVKLAQVLAAELCHDGCVDAELRRRLRYLQVWLDMMFESE